MQQNFVLVQNQSIRRDKLEMLNTNIGLDKKINFFYLKVPFVDHLGNHGSQVAWQLPTPPRTNESDAYMKSEQNPFQKEQLIEYQWISLIGGHFFLFFSHLGNHESQKAPLQTHLRN